MTTWAILLLLICIYTNNTNGTKEQQMDKTSSEMYSPQFLHDDSIFSAVTTTEDGVTQGEVNETPKVSTTLKNDNDTFHGVDEKYTQTGNLSHSNINARLLTPTNLYLTDLFEAENPQKISDNKNVTIKIHSNIPGKLNDTQVITTTLKINQTKAINKNDNIYSRSEKEIDETKLNMNLDVNKNNIPNNNLNETSFTVIYSKPYESGKNYFESEKVAIIYPSNNDSKSESDVNNEDKIEILKISKTTSAVITNDKKKLNSDISKDNSETIMNATPKSLTKQQIIRHILYTRRPNKHYLFKIKNNEKLITNNDEEKQKDLILPIENLELTKNISSTNLKEFPNSNDFESSHIATGNLFKSRKRYQPMIPTIENKQLNMTSHIKNTEDNFMNVTNHIEKDLTNTTTKHYEHTNSNNTMNSKKPNATGKKEITIPNIYNTENITSKPFRPSPEYNPSDIRSYDMNMLRFGHRFIIPNTPKPQVSQQETIMNTTNESKRTRSILESMMQMIKNIRRLPKRHQPEYTRDDEISNSYHNLGLVENYESKKIKPQGEKPIGQQYSQLENSSEIRRNKPVRRPLMFRGLNEPVLSVRPEYKNVFTTLNNGQFKTNQIQTLNNLSTIEHFIKMNILKDLEQIKLKLQSRSRNQSNRTRYVPNNNYVKENGRKNIASSGIRRPKQNENLQLLISKSGTNTNKKDDESNQRAQVRQRIRYYQTNPNTNYTRNKNILRNSKIIQRLRYQEIKVNNETTNSNKELERPKLNNDNNNDDLNSRVINERQNSNLRRLNRFKFLKQHQIKINESDNFKMLDVTDKLVPINITSTDNENVSLPILMDNIDTNINDDNQSKFIEKEIELNASGSENNNVTVTDVELRNDTINNFTNFNETKKDDLETLESERNEKSLYNEQQFITPQELQSGFLPMIINVQSRPIRPIGFKTLRHLNNPLITSESGNQEQQFDIASPNLFTFHSREIKQPTFYNGGSKIENKKVEHTLQNSDQEYVTRQNEELNHKNDISPYETALKQYNEALKMYNNYLEQFLKSHL